MSAETPAPLVSWVIPVKNGMPFLPETLASIAAQTFRDFEVLVWDNGSTDGTVEEINKWIPGRLPGRVVTGQPENQGASRRKLVEMARGEFCACLDADDVAMPDRLEKQIAFFERHPEVGLLGGQVKFIDAAGRPLDGTDPYPLEHHEIVARFLNDNPFWHPTVIFRKAAALAAGNYRDLPTVQDYDFWFRMATHGQIANLPDILISYRIHERSVTHLGLKRRELQRIADEVFAANARGLFGWDKTTAEDFRHGRLKFMLGAAWRLARFRAREEKTTPWKILRRTLVLDGLWRRTRGNDYLSRLAFMWLDRREPFSSRLWRHARKWCSVGAQRP